MRITVTRSGGLAGLTETVAAADTAQLPADAARRLEQILDDTKFFDLPPRVHGGAVGADLYRYAITVDDGGRRHSVAFLDDGSPATAPLRRLVEAAKSSG